MNALLTAMRGNMRQYGMIIALVAIGILFQILTGGLLLKPQNVSNLILQNSYVFILAIGMMLVIITGHIDLSVGSVAAFVGAVAAVLMVNQGWSTIPTIIAALAIGALVGVWQGFWIAYMRIPSFIVTLAGMLIFRGLTLTLTDGKAIAPFPEDFRAIATSFIRDFAGGSTLTTIILGVAVSVFLVVSELRGRARRAKYGLPLIPMGLFVARLVLLVAAINAFTVLLAQRNGLPTAGLIVIVLVVVYSYVMSRTVLGRHVYAVGGNEKAALLSGVRTQRVTFLVFVNMGVLSAIAGLIVTARLNAAGPRAGTNFELDAIAAAFIGGASAAGGVGTVVGAIIGAMVMGIMTNGMQIIGIEVDWQSTIKGLVLLAAVFFDVYSKNKSGKTSFFVKIFKRQPKDEPDSVLKRTSSGSGEKVGI
ncbi:putative multiple sugar transport system permease protein [Kineococcus xinjiangensis]|uniref:Xylose transport system permease protein XylH n=1 Tax=Kineococcus xinjiangensis TaxID=512762 RepID=A0A2S6IV34_9ACTN|nr:multiple monosaccharide ABC transporter permease [Kineococcus xinjiangensis]PPK98013.1 putative multiple sugar transport system permease protein [Kineococcus xinjiangensis]